MARKKTKLVYGVGINDADYVVGVSKALPTVNGKRKQKVTWCPFYLRWCNMLGRCYSQLQYRENPSYVGCSVADEWLYFSRFKAWMEQQDWQGKQLDKDILVQGNKVYSADFCVFVDKKVNTFITEKKSNKGEFPAGVDFHKGKYRSKGRSVQTGKQEHLGCYDTPEEAYQVWLNFKLQQAIILADQQADERVAKALLDRYGNYENLTKAA